MEHLISWFHRAGLEQINWLTIGQKCFASISDAQAEIRLIWSAAWVFVHLNFKFRNGWNHQQRHGKRRHSLIILNISGFYITITGKEIIFWKNSYVEESEHQIIENLTKKLCSGIKLQEFWEDWTTGSHRTPKKYSLNINKKAETLL